MNNLGEIGEPVQILKLNRLNRSYVLDTDALNQIFLHDHLEHVNLSVVSIAGAFRKGKSFMLNLFLRYLSVYYENCDNNSDTDWLDEQCLSLTGFEWRGGSEGMTKGIWIWSKIFTRIMPNGQQIGIVLMDTQGTFDCETSFQHGLSIFTLSTMLSSIQIYNVFNNLQEDDLQHLQLFTEYGQIAKENTQSEHKPFQQLMFLVRDWNYPYEHNYGLIGGKNKLNNYLQINHLRQEPENQALRKNLISYFDEVSCFLMPAPGERIRTAKEFDAKVSDLSSEFIEHVKKLVPYLLKPANIVRSGLKKLNGDPVRPMDFCNLIQQYWSVFRHGTLPEAKSILIATAESVCLSAKNEACQFYISEILSYKHPDNLNIDQDIVMSIHKKVTDEAFERYNAKAVIGGPEISNRYRQELKDFLNEHLVYYIEHIYSEHSKRVEEKLLREIDTRTTTNLTNLLSNSMDGILEITRRQQQLETKLVYLTGGSLFFTFLLAIFTTIRK